MTNEQANGAGEDAPLRQQIGQGFEMLRQGRLEDAVRISDGLVAAHGGNAEVLFLASEVRLFSGDPESALGFITAAVDAAPGQMPLLLKKAENLLMLRRRADARQVVAEAAVLAGNDGQALWTIGKSYSKCNDPVNARKFHERALHANFNHPGLLPRCRRKLTPQRTHLRSMPLPCLRLTAPQSCRLRSPRAALRSLPRM